MTLYDVAVVGGGLAGRAAASAAAAAGARTMLVDESSDPDVALPGVEMLARTSVWGLYPGFQLGLSPAGEHPTIEAKRVILATGTTERAIAFPGSDLPGVMTGRALKRSLLEWMVWPGGRRVAVVGDHPSGEELIELVQRLGGEAMAILPADPALVSAVSRDGVVGAVRFGGVEIETDIVALCVGEQSDIALATMIECEVGYSEALGGFVPFRTEALETTVSGLYVCGSVAGIGAREEHEAEGRLAGLTAAGSLGFIERAVLDREQGAFRATYPDRDREARAIASSWTQHDVARAVATVREGGHD